MAMSQRRELPRLYGMDTPEATQQRHAGTARVEGCDRVWIEFQAALQQLPLLPRVAFLLSDVLGKPIGEVSALLGRDADTCRELIDDARTRLRALRAGAHGDHP
jgi:DNA-directed RNA polymerase specialized sigma24 family protein